jgi:hypothetical protein
MKTTVATACYLVENGALEFGQTGRWTREGVAGAGGTVVWRWVDRSCVNNIEFQSGRMPGAGWGRSCRRQAAKNRFKTLTGDSNGLS